MKVDARVEDAGEVIRTRSLGKRFVTEQGAKLSVFANVDLSVREGEFVSIVGPSGCGKSTLLKIVAGLETPTEGEVLVGGELETKPSRDRGFVFQEDAVFPWLTVIQNVRYGPSRARWPAERIEKTCEHFLRLVGLEEFRDYYPKELSGGMRKRVAIAMVFANNPRILLMDEPFGSLDYVTKSELQDELLRIWQSQKKTVLFVTHDLEEAIYLADRILVMMDGRIVHTLRVPLDRPRSSAMRTGRVLQKLKEELWALITR